MGQLEVVNADSTLAEQAMPTAGTHQIALWDAMTAAAAREAGCGEMWPEDRAVGASLRDVHVVNPLT